MIISKNLSQYLITQIIHKIKGILQEIQDGVSGNYWMDSRFRGNDRQVNTTMKNKGSMFPPMDIGAGVYKP
jgi:hypothetical protein